MSMGSCLQLEGHKIKGLYGTKKKKAQKKMLKDNEKNTLSRIKWENIEKGTTKEI